MLLHAYYVPVANDGALLCGLSQWVVPELVATAFIPLFLLLTWHWIVFLLTAPFAAYLIYRLDFLHPVPDTVMDTHGSMCVCVCSGT